MEGKEKREQGERKEKRCRNKEREKPRDKKRGRKKILVERRELVSEVKCS